MTTRQDAIRAAALVAVQAYAESDALTPRAAAEAAWYPGHRLGTVDAIEALIIRQRREAEDAARVAGLLPPIELIEQRAA